MSPIADCYLKQRQLNQMEAFYPLRVYVCVSVHVVQLKGLHFVAFTIFRLKRFVELMV